MATREYAPQGYWDGNKFVFPPAPPPVWPEPEPMLALSGPDSVSPKSGGIPWYQGYGTSDPGVTGNVAYGWADKAQDNLSQWGNLFGGGDNLTGAALATAIDAGTAVPAAAPTSPSDLGWNLGAGAVPATDSAGWPPTGAGSRADTPAEFSVAAAKAEVDESGQLRYDALGQDRTSDTYQKNKAAQDAVVWGFRLAGQTGLAFAIAGTRYGGVTDPYGRDADGNYRFGASQRMGTIQAVNNRAEGWEPGFAVTNDDPGMFGLGTLGRTGISMTSAMFDAYGGKGGKWGYGLGVKSDGTLGHLTAKDVNDIDGMADQAGLGGKGSAKAGAALSAADRAAAIDAQNWAAAGGDVDGGGTSYGYEGSGPGGGWEGWHEGGFVEGPDPEVEGEEFTAEMLEGEYVIQPEAVDRIKKIFGVDFLDRLNALDLSPGFTEDPTPEVEGLLPPVTESVGPEVMGPPVDLGIGGFFDQGTVDFLPEEVMEPPQADFLESEYVPRAAKRNVFLDAILDQMKRTNLQGSAGRIKQDLGSGVNISNIGAGGTATTQIPIGDYQADLGIGGFFGQGTVDFPPELQRYGVPQEETFINKGITNVGFGVTNPRGQRLGLGFNPSRESLMLRFNTPLPWRRQR